MPQPTKTKDSQSPLDRLLSSIGELHNRQNSKGAHSYRTSLRRFHAWSAVAQPQLDAKKKQALKFLEKLRKTTGKLRDSSVHLDLLNEIKGANPKEKRKVEKALKTRRKSARKKLQNLLSNGSLKATLGNVRLIGEPPIADPQSSHHPLPASDQLALEQYRAFVGNRAPLSPENLHSYRLACKGFRYTAELAGETPHVKSLVETWKTIQDVSGDWHDYVVLSDLTEEVCGDCTLHSLVVGLRDKKYDQSVTAIEEAEHKLLSSPAKIPKKEPKGTPVQRRRAG